MSEVSGAGGGVGLSAPSSVPVSRCLVCRRGLNRWAGVPMFITRTVTNIGQDWR